MTDDDEFELPDNPQGIYLLKDIRAAKRAKARAQKTGQAAGKKICNYATVLSELRGNEALAGFVAFDEFSQVVVLRHPIPDYQGGPTSAGPFEPRPWHDEDATALAAYLNGRGFTRAPIGIVRDVVALEARSHGFHPIRDYLAGLTWDGVHRIGRFFIHHCGARTVRAVDPASPEDAKAQGKQKAEALAYLEAVSRCFFVGAVARVMQPGVKLDNMVVLEGLQGLLKSKLLRTLAVQDNWFSDSLPHNLENKDARGHLAGKWLVELSELSQFRGSSVEMLKSYLSCQVDKFRPAYGRNEISIPRQCIFVGSTNARTYLHDPTGGRRFWPILLTKIKLKNIEPLVPQLWAEAFAAWKDREQWWLTPKLEALAAEQQADRMQRDPWHDLIAGFVDSKDGEFFTTAAVFSHIGVKQQDQKRSDEMRVADVLTELGCLHERHQEARNRRWGWVRPIGWEAQSVAGQGFAPPRA